MSEILSAVEVMDHATIEFVKEFNKLDSPIGHFPFYLFLETEGNNEEHDFDKLNKFFQLILNKNLIINGTVVHDPNKIEVSEYKCFFIFMRWR